MPASLTINGVNLESLGCYLEDPSDGLLSAPTRSVARAPVVGAMGSIAVGMPTYDRPVEFRGIVRPAANVTADRLALEDALKALCRGTFRVVWTQDSSVRTILATLKKLSIATRGQQHPLLSVASEWTLAFDTEGAAWADVVPTIRHLTAATAPHNCPVGTAPSRPIIELFGGATNPEVQIRTAGGELMYRLRFTDTLTTAQSIEIDRVAGRIWKWSSDVRSDGLSLLNAADRADFARMALDPQHGDAASGPTVSTSSGTGRVMYWKGYL